MPNIKFLRVSEKACMSATLELSIKINDVNRLFMLTPEILDMTTEDFLDYIEKNLDSYYDRFLENDSLLNS